MVAVGLTDNDIPLLSMPDELVEDSFEAGISSSAIVFEASASAPVVSHCFTGL
jgi:hypothetical protein